MNDQMPTVKTHTATVTITVSVDGESKLHTATGETDGDGYRLAKSLLQAAAGDATTYLVDMTDR